MNIEGVKPKEKAKQLVEKFRNSITSFLSDNMKNENAKQCAIIAVDEIMEELENNKSYFMAENLIFWQEVKEEINKL
jgi:hypothetical protein